MRKRVLMVLGMLMVFAIQMWSAEVVYSLDAVQNSQNTAYANSFDVTINGMSWNVPGNQYFEGFWRFGGKKITNQDRALTANEVMNGAVNRLVIYHNGVNNAGAKINYVKVQVAKDAAFDKLVDDVEETNPPMSVDQADSIVLLPKNISEWPDRAYYRIVFNITNTNSSNRGINFVKAVFYAGEGGGTPDPQPQKITITQFRLKAEMDVEPVWENVHLYAWYKGGDEPLGTWPGTAAKKDADGKWWSFTFDEPVTDTINIIWNNGSNSYQTRNIEKVTENRCYELTGETSDINLFIVRVIDCDGDTISGDTIPVIPPDTISGDTIPVIPPDTTIVPPDTIPVDTIPVVVDTVWYQLTLTAGVGGKVSPESGKYQEGTKLTLTATPEEGYLFAQWSDKVATNPRELVLTSDTTLEAQFSVREKSAVVIVALNGGTVSTVKEWYYTDESVTVEAKAKSGYRFHSWSDGSTENPRTWSAARPIKEFAVFLPEYTLSISAENGGTVNTSVNGKYIETMCADLEATPNEGYEFLKWSDDVTDNPRTIHPTANVRLSAQFHRTDEGIEDIMADETVSIYTIDGRVLLYRHKGFALPTTPGIYIVRTNNQSYKVIVK